jgi:hypothetical protein
VAGAGQGAVAGHWVVDHVQACRADLSGGFDALFDLLEDEVVELGQQFVGRKIDIGERTHGAAQLAHRGGGVDAVADDIADDQSHTGAGQRNDIEPVAAHTGVRIRR